MTPSPRTPCRAQGCSLGANYGPLICFPGENGNRETRGRPFCHTHWWMLHHTFRIHINHAGRDGIEPAVEWLKEQEAKTI